MFRTAFAGRVELTSHIELTKLHRGLNRLHRTVRVGSYGNLCPCGQVIALPDGS